MEEDYERTNAREWDLHQGGGRLQQKSEDSWQVVGEFSKKQQKQPQRPASATPPSYQNIQRQGIDQRRQAASQPKSQGFKDFLALCSPQPTPQREGQTQPLSGLGNQRQQQEPAKKPVTHSQNNFSQQDQEHQPRKQQFPSEWPKQEARQQQAGTRRRAPRIAQGSDNMGERLWRNRQEAHGHVPIPVDLFLNDSGHEEIMRHHGTFVYNDDKQRGNGVATFGIWGEQKAVAATIQDINAWIEDFRASGKANKTEKFAKICSLTPVLRTRAEKEWEREVKRHLYRQFPPPSKAFEAIATFHWPVKDYRPEEILGSSYEALDPIRMESKCYVVFDKEQGLFQIMGRADAVQAGLMRLKGTCFQIAARQIPPVERYLLSNGETTSSFKHVVLVDYERLQVISGERSGQVKVAHSPRLDNPDSNGSDKFLPNSFITEYLRRTILFTLRNLHYYHGSIQMRIRLGTFLATQYRKTDSGVYPIDDYKGMIRESAFHGEVTQELGEKAIESAALNTLRTATAFLTPQDHTISDLADIKPVYTAVFTFADPTNSEAGDIRLTVMWEELQDSLSKTPTYDQISKKWTRLERDAETPSAILNISLSDLTTGMAWQFDVHAAQTIDEARLPRGFSGFGNTVCPNATIARQAVNPLNADMSFVTYRPSYPHLKDVEQRITYRYGLIGSDYTLELTRFQYSIIPARRLPMLSKATPTLYEARWALSLCRIEWDTMFTQNERLPVGEKADWSDEEDVWFPSDYDNAAEKKQMGFEQMMEKLNRVASLLIEGVNLQGPVW